MASSSPAKTVRRNNDPPPQLSCELCKLRKIRCDKLNPCTNCVSHGVECKTVRRARLPRGRHAQPSRGTNLRSSDGSGGDTVSSDLSSRLQKLETLVDDMRSHAGMAVGATSNIASSGDHTNTVSEVNATKQETGNHYPESFWESLTDEINGLRDVVESALGNAEEDSTQAPNPNDVASVLGAMRPLSLSGPGSSSDYESLGPSQDPTLKGKLFDIYLNQVDPIIKILHRPSLQKMMKAGVEEPSTSQLKYGQAMPLSTAICFAAATSLTEDQCITNFQMTKEILVADCRRECEVAIESSDLLATRDIRVLQAFTLYLFARKSEDRGKSIWTLIGLAVRIARGFGLDRPFTPTPQGPGSFFEQQMRCRLWLSISLMDMQAYFIHASKPLIDHEEVASALSHLRHINDADFDHATDQAVPDREELTDITFALLTYHLQLAGRLLNFPQSTSLPERLAINWEARRNHAKAFEDSVLQLVQFCRPESSPRAWFVWHSAQCLVAGIRLSVPRPFKPSSIPPPPPKDRTEMLRLAIQVLEEALLMYTDARAEPFRWYISIPWHVVAVGIAECYVCTDHELVKRAWPVIEASYQKHEAVITRYSGGVLKGPLGKLMEKAREKFAGSSISNLPIAATAEANHGLDASLETLSFDMNVEPVDIQKDLAGLAENDLVLSQEMSDESWKFWDEFISGMSEVQDIPSDTLFSDSNIQYF